MRGFIPLQKLGPADMLILVWCFTGTPSLSFENIVYTPHDGFLPRASPLRRRSAGQEELSCWTSVHSFSLARMPFSHLRLFFDLDLISGQFSHNAFFRKALQVYHQRTDSSRSFC